MIAGPVLLVLLTFLVTTYGKDAIGSATDFLTGTDEADKLRVIGPVVGADLAAAAGMAVREVLLVRDTDRKRVHSVELVGIKLVIEGGAAEVAAEPR